jgi:hypothetical protein
MGEGSWFGSGSGSGSGSGARFCVYHSSGIWTGFFRGWSFCGVGEEAGREAKRRDLQAGTLGMLGC